MNPATVLLELQEADLALDRTRQELAEIEAVLADRSEPEAAHAALASAQERVQALQRDQRALDGDREDLGTKIASFEKRMYGGTVHNIRELAGLDTEVALLKNQRREVEDRELAVMADLEEAESDYRQAEARARETEGNWQANQARLHERRIVLLREQAALEERRSGIVSRVDRVSLSAYEALRARRGGRVMARVEQGMCQGCRITLPMGELQRLRHGAELVQCSSCSRILYG